MGGFDDHSRFRDLVRRMAFEAAAPPFRNTILIACLWAVVFSFLAFRPLLHILDGAFLLFMIVVLIMYVLGPLAERGG
jgi:hypothetical protein